MKKIFLLLNIVALCLLASCNPNEYAKFDDKDAFVAFGAATYAISENGGTLKVPVTLASIKGIETTVKVAATDGSAKSGVNYNLKNGGQLTFNADNRTANVEIEIVDLAGEYTGDLNFTLSFSDLGGVNAGTASSAKVTINDLDHPLSFILGTYDVVVDSYGFGDAYQSYMVIHKDEEDVTKVWVNNLFFNAGWDIDQTRCYGIVSDDKTTITFPLGQQVEYVHSKGNVFLWGMDNNMDLYNGGNLVVYIEDNGKTLRFNDEVGPCLIIGENFTSWAAINFPGAVATKQ